MRTARWSVRFAALALLAAACSPDSQPTAPATALSAGRSAVITSAMLDEANRRLAAAGASYRVARAEMSLVASAPPHMASVVFANDRSLHIGVRWVTGDPRRPSGDVLRHYFFDPLGGANTASGTQDGKAQVAASFATWTGLDCTSLEFQQAAFDGTFPSGLLGGDPSVGEVNTVGFLPGPLFDQLGPDGSQFILGATFPFVWGATDSEGNFVPSDIDRDGSLDYAFAEVWYNNALPWTLTGFGPGSDVQTVALHENGHALGLGHFGRIHASFSPLTGLLHVSPRAVMNAIILGTLRRPLGTDRAALCGYYATWP